jgi:hypothetical protein
VKRTKTKGMLNIIEKMADKDETNVIIERKYSKVSGSSLINLENVEFI